MHISVSADFQAARYRRFAELNTKILQFKPAGCHFSEYAARLVYQCGSCCTRRDAPFLQVTHSRSRSGPPGNLVSSLHDQKHEALHACTYKISKATPYSSELSQPNMQFFFAAILTISSMLLQVQAVPLGSLDTALQARSCDGEHRIKLSAHRDHLTHASRMHRHPGCLQQSWNCHLFLHEHFQHLQGLSVLTVIVWGKTEWVFASYYII